MKDLPVNYRPVVLITGCSSGIGWALAKMFYHMDTFRVIATARDKSLGLLKSEFPINENFCILSLDVTDEKSRLNLFNQVCDKWGRIDILINNAGICYRSSLEEMQDKDESLQMQTNYLGPVALTRLVLPAMRKNGRGKIINISSVSGMLAMPTMASYSASKYALEGAMEALWYEAKPFGIDVSLVQPGFVKSSSYEKVKYSVRAQLSTQLERTYRDIYKQMAPFIERFMKYGWATPESIADLVYHVIKTESPPLWIPASLDAEFLYYLKRFFPRRLLLPFLYWMLPGSQGWGEKFSRKRKKSYSGVMLRNIFYRWRAYFGKIK